MNGCEIERELPDGSTLALYFSFMTTMSAAKVMLTKAFLLAPKEPRKRTRRMISGWSWYSHEMRNFPDLMERPEPSPEEIDKALEFFRSRILFSNE